MQKLFCLLLIFGLFAFAFGDEAQTADQPKKDDMNSEKAEASVATTNPLVEMYISHGDTAYGKVVIEVFEKEVPIHAKNFLSLVDEGYYNGLTFHRVVPNFVIQGGDPTGTGTGGPPGRLQDDPSSPYKHDRGTLAMARSGEGASKSQFYVNLKENYRLDDMGFLIYAKVVEGMDIFDKIATVETSGSKQSPKPVVPVVMTKVVRAAAAAEPKAVEGKTE